MRKLRDPLSGLLRSRVPRRDRRRRQCGGPSATVRRACGARGHRRMLVARI